MLHSSGFYCDWCQKPILLQKTIDHVCLPCCSHVMHYHRKNKECREKVLFKADIHSDILSALQHKFITREIALDAMKDNILTYKQD